MDATAGSITVTAAVGAVPDAAGNSNTVAASATISLGEPASSRFGIADTVPDAAVVCDPSCGSMGCPNEMYCINCRDNLVLQVSAAVALNGRSMLALVAKRRVLLAQLRHVRLRLAESVHGVPCRVGAQLDLRLHALPEIRLQCVQTGRALSVR